MAQPVNQSHTPTPEEERPWYIRFLPIVLFIIVGLLFYFFIPLLTVERLMPALQAVFVITGSLLPAIIYTSFIRGRLPTLFAEYRQNLRRLGFPANARTYSDKFDVVYGRQPDAMLSPYLHAPIMVSCLLALVGWLLVFFPINAASATLIPNPTPLAYAFLGAYVFGLGSLVRQYVTEDLQLRYYASLSGRFLVVFVLAWIIGLVVAVNGVNGAEPVSQDGYLLVAFVIGLFPATGLRVAQRAGTAILGIAIKGFKESQPLSLLDGLNAYQEDRLLLEGIENLQNLTCANIVDLMLRTRFPVEQIVDWIDQALLHLHARERMSDFQRSGIRTATDFLDAYHPYNVAEEDWTARRLALAKLLDQKEDENSQPQHTLIFLQTLADALRLDPNLYHVRHWREHETEALPEDVEHERIAADLKLIQRRTDEAIEAYNKLLRDFPGHATTLLYRGMAYADLGDLNQAINDYNLALEEGGKRWEGARSAYVKRAIALRQLNEIDRAVESLRDALQIFGHYPEADFELAYIQLVYLYEYDEAIERLQRLVELKFREPTTLSNLGLAYFERWDERGRRPEESDDLEQARRALERAIRLKPDMIAAYVNLANVLDAQEETKEAIRVLTTALRYLEDRPDSANAYRIRLLRGNLHVKEELYADAVGDYEAATQLEPNDSAAFFNMGVAWQELGQYGPAKEAFQSATRINPNHAPAFQRLGDILLEEGELAEAKSYYTRVLELLRQAETEDKLGLALIRLRLGRLYRRVGEREVDARRELEQALQLAGELEEDLVYTQAAYELGLFYLEAQDTKPAIEWLVTSVELFDVLGETRAGVKALLALARAYRLAGKNDAALETLRDARRELAHIFNPQSESDSRLQQEILDEIEAIQAA